MTIARPPIPNQIKLKLRQEAYFGCCICGLPIIVYHHIIEYAEENHFRVEDMMVVCPNHHAEITARAMNESTQRYYKNNPFNKGKGYANGLLRINQGTCIVAVGSNQIVGETICEIDGDVLFTLGKGQKGTIEISVSLFDELGNLLVIIEKNEWLSGDPIPWDIEASFQYLKIRNKVRSISLELNAKKDPFEFRASLWKNKEVIIFEPNAIKFDGSVVNNSQIRNLALVGGILFIDTKTKTAGIKKDNRFKNFVLISEGNLDLRIKKALVEWEKLQLN